VPRLEWTALVRADLLAIVDYISDDNPDAAQRLKDDIEAKAAKLPEYPQLYRFGKLPGTREMVVSANYIVGGTSADLRRSSATALAHNFSESCNAR